MTDRTCVRDHAGAFAWGFAEATFFFLVPDVGLTRVAARRPRRAFVTVGSAVAGAVAGGLVTYDWARANDPARTRAALRRIPSISGAMVDRVDVEVTDGGLRAMVLGPLRGIPYKVYARSAGHRGLSPAAFAAWSVPARTPRFVLVVGLAAGLRALADRMVGRERAERLVTPTHAAFWIAFYAWYFRTVGREAAGEER
ncbi:hypothetical protein [Mariniluteicoccus endophyticus]